MSVTVPVAKNTKLGQMGACKIYSILVKCTLVRENSITTKKKCLSGGLILTPEY